jgi:hypothetical protein
VQCKPVPRRQSFDQRPDIPRCPRWRCCCHSVSPLGDLMPPELLTSSDIKLQILDLSCDPGRGRAGASRMTDPPCCRR